jgi:hypothetical protein
VDPLGVTALGADRGAAGVQVQILDVERQHLTGTRGGLIQHAPQRFLPQWHVATSQRPFDRRAWQGVGGVGGLAAPFDARSQAGARTIAVHTPTRW